MPETLSQIPLCLFLAALLGFIIGYLMCKNACWKEEQERMAAAAAQRSTATPKG